MDFRQVVTLTTLGAALIGCSPGEPTTKVKVPADDKAPVGAKAPSTTPTSEDPVAKAVRQAGEQNIPPVTAELDGTARRVPYSIVVKTGPFDAKKHQVTSAGNYGFKVDGRFAIGTDGMVPFEQIDEFTFSWDDNVVAVPPKFWSDCFNPFLGNSPPQHLFAKPGPEPDSVYLLLGGSDAAGTFGAVWILRKNGKHERWVSWDEETVNDLLEAIDEKREFRKALWQGAEVVR